MKSKTEATDKRQEARSSLLVVPSFSGYLLQQSKELPSGSPWGPSAVRSAPFQAAGEES